MTITKNLLLNWHSSMKKKFRKIRMIFDVENWLWKSDLGTFWRPMWTSVKVKSKNYFSFNDFFAKIKPLVDSRPQNSTTEVTLKMVHPWRILLLSDNVSFWVLSFIYFAMRQRPFWSHAVFHILLHQQAQHLHKISSSFFLKKKKSLIYS